MPKANEVSKFIDFWKKRNIIGYFCENKDEASRKISELVQFEDSVGFSGSVTLDQLGVIHSLEARGNKVFNPYKENLSREESLDIRRQASAADTYLASANAVARTGELVFFSAYGNRISGVSYAKNVIIVCGINKIVDDLGAAIKRSREYATPLNCKRLNWESPCFKDGVCKNEICLFPDQKRMCCQILIIEAEAVLNRLKVILVGESLGY